jgi:hypothetical protein
MANSGNVKAGIENQIRHEKGEIMMGRIRRRMGIFSSICVFASLMMLNFAVDAAGQQGGGMMMGPCGMYGQGQGMMMPMMGGQKDHGKHPPSASLMKLLHKWGKLFFAQRAELGLTEEQLDEIESILMSHVKSAVRKKADLKILLIESQEALVKEEINLKTVEKKLKAMEALNTEMAMEGIRTLKKALAVLTPEQQKKIRDLFKNTCLMRGKSKGMMSQGGMMPGMTGRGGMTHGMMGQGGMMPGMMGKSGAAARGEGEKTSDHDH